jgi:hypothetical protein
MAYNPRHPKPVSNVWRVNHLLSAQSRRAHDVNTLRQTFLANSQDEVN